jgi:aminopeptidase YwaD
MKRSLKDTASYLAMEDHADRLERLETVLKESDIAYERQEENGTVNLLCGNRTADQPLPLFTAHYDAVPGSTGANDNLSSVSILTALLETCADQCQVVFLDGEESGHSGARLFLKKGSLKKVSAAVVLDVCGYGDLEAYRIRRGGRNPFFRKMFGHACRKEYGLAKMSYLPDSDDLILKEALPAVAEISALPEGDVQALNALGNYYGPLMKHMPAYAEAMEHLEVSSTMHGGSMDDPEILQEEIMRKILSHLYTVLKN